jgi:superfamily II DNA/RNA helicase
MIATEAASEGVNLQFCSLVMNYDLPWNPQRIEQRIGRCHRYGQKHDVVVINFLNERNEADRAKFGDWPDILARFVDVAERGADHRTDGRDAG